MPETLARQEKPMKDPLLAAMLDRMMEHVQGQGGPGGIRHVYVIVPARLRAHTERETLRYLRDHAAAARTAGVMVDVHSFTSFTRSVIGNHGETACMRPTLSPFVLRAFLAREMTHGPETFRAAGRTFGSVNQFAAQVEELRKTGVTSSDLERLAREERRRALSAVSPATAGEDMDEAGRFGALHTLTALVERRFGARYALPGEIAPVMESWLREHGAESVFLLYGFERFAPSEALAVAAMRRYSQVRADDGTASGSAWRALSDSMNGQRFSGYGPLASVKRPTVPVEALAVDDPAEEVRFVAADIAARVRKSAGMLSYGDVLVTARDLASYRAMLDTEFAYRGVPVNATPAAMMVDDPIADVVLGLMDPAFLGRDPAALMRVLRTGLLRGIRIPDRYAAKGSAKTRKLGPSVLDRVENLLAESDPKRIWNRDEAAARAAENPEGSDPWNALIAVDDFMVKASAVLTPQPGVTVREYLTGLVALLVDMGVNKGLRDITSDEADREERALLKSRRTWDTIMAVFDEMVGEFADEPFADFEATFRDNLAALLEHEPSGARPKALNAVDVVAYPTPMRPYKLVYVLGASEAQVPAVPHETGLLDDGERETLAAELEERGRHVEARAIRSGTVDGKARREPEAFNLVLAGATEQVVISWPKTVDGAVQQPSAYVAVVASTADDGGQATSDRLADKEAESDTAWAHDIADALVDAPVGASDAGETQQNPTVGRELATLLFAKHEQRNNESSPLVFDASVSSIEQYCRNPYDYFLERGLRVKAIRPWALDPMLEGIFYHAVLEHAVDRWMRRHPGEQPELQEMREYIRDYARLDRSTPYGGEYRCGMGGDPDDGWSVLDDDGRMAVLDSSNRMRAVYGQLVGTLLNMAAHMDGVRRQWGEGKALRYGEAEMTAKPKDLESGKVSTKRFIPLHAERQFGDINGVAGDWEALAEHELQGVIGGREVMVPLHVNGKIDRIDRIVAPDGTGVPESLLILDYKSSAKSLFGSFPGKDGDGDRGTVVYSGRELQLFTYAYVATQRLPEVPVAGLYFLPIKMKNLGRTEIKFDDRYKGIRKLPEWNQSTGQVLDTLLADGRVAGWNMNLSAGGTTVASWRVSARLHWPLDDAGDFEAICAFVQHKIHEVCDAIVAGVVPVAPYRAADDNGTKNAKDGTTYSDYADVYALDLISGEVFHKEQPISRAELVDAGKMILGRCNQSTTGTESMETTE